MKYIIPIMFVLAAACWGGYRYYTNTPEYSLTQMKKALDGRDWTSFQKLVDVDGVLNSLIDQNLQETMREGSGDPSMDAAGAMMGAGLINMMKPEIIRYMKSEVRRFVDKGSFDTKAGPQGGPSLAALWKKLGGTGENFVGLADIRKTGKTAHAGLRFRDDKLDLDITLDLKLRKKDGYWQLADITNFGELMARVEEIEEERLAEVNGPVQEEMDGTLTLVSVRKDSAEESWGAKKVVYSFTLRNDGEQPIREFRAELVCKHADGTVLDRETIAQDWAMEPGETHDGTMDKFISEYIDTDVRLYDTWVESQLAYEFVVQNITFADGTGLKLKTKAEMEK